MTGIWWRFFQKRSKLTNTYDGIWRLFIEKRLYNTSPADKKGVYCQSLCSSGYGNCECLFSTCLRSNAFHGHVWINSTTAIWSSSFDLRHFTDFSLLSTEKGLDNESVIRPSVTWLKNIDKICQHGFLPQKDLFVVFQTQWAFLTFRSFRELWRKAVARKFFFATDMSVIINCSYK